MTDFPAFCRWLLEHLAILLGAIFVSAVVAALVVCGFELYKWIHG